MLQNMYFKDDHFSGVNQKNIILEFVNIIWTVDNSKLAILYIVCFNFVKYVYNHQNLLNNFPFQVGERLWVLRHFQ